MAEPNERPTTGKTVIWLYRTESQKLAGKEAWGMALETNAELNKSRSTELLQTKRRAFRIPGSYEITGSATSFYSEADTSIETMNDAIDNAELIEFWLIETMIKNEEGKFKAEFFEGYITSFVKSAPTEGAVEVQLEYELDAPGAKGYATLTEEQEEVVSVVFRDTVPVV